MAPSLCTRATGSTPMGMSSECLVNYRQEIIHSRSDPMHAFTVHPQKTEPSPPSTKPRRRWRRWSALTLLLICIAGLVWAVRPDPHLSRAQALQKELFSPDEQEPQPRGTQSAVRGVPRARQAPERRPEVGARRALARTAEGRDGPVLLPVARRSRPGISMSRSIARRR